MEEKLDRRQQRTRKLLRDALIALIIERGFDELTIEDITEKADLRRATFYLHYSNKEDFLLKVLQETFDELVVQMEPLIQGDQLAGKTQVETYEVMYRHVGENGELYCVILAGQGGAAIARRIREYLAGHVQKALKLLEPDFSPVPSEVLANYMAGAELGLMTWWLENGKPYSPEQMAEMTHRMILKGVLDGVDERQRAALYM